MAPQFTSPDIGNSLSERRAERRPLPRNMLTRLPTKKFFFFSKFLILSTGLPRRRLPLKIAARWRYKLPTNNLTAHYKSQFCVNFYFCLAQEAQKCL